MGVGLDIGSKSIKIVQLEKSGDSFRLRAAGIVSHKNSLPEQIAEDKELAPLAQTLKKLHKEAKVSSKDVSISLPEQQAFTRTIKFPLLEDSEVASAVKWEAEQYIPIPISEAIVQHQVLDRFPNAQPPQVLVLLVASSRMVVEKYAKLVQMAGLNLVSVETELMSLVRSLAPHDQTVVIVDSGARSTNIAIANKGNLAFARSIATAGEAFTRAVAQGMGIQDIQAEEYKRTYGLSGEQLEGKIKSVLEPIINVVSDEVKKSIHFYQTEEKGSMPSSVVLSGGSAAMPEMASLMNKAVNIEVVVANPFTNVTMDPETSKSLTPYAPFYSTAVGLAMKQS